MPGIRDGRDLAAGSLVRKRHVRGRVVLGVVQPKFVALPHGVALGHPVHDLDPHFGRPVDIDPGAVRPGQQFGDRACSGGPALGPHLGNVGQAKLGRLLHGPGEGLGGVLSDHGQHLRGRLVGQRIPGAGGYGSCQDSGSDYSRYGHGGHPPQPGGGHLNSAPTSQLISSGYASAIAVTAPDSCCPLSLDRAYWARLGGTPLSSFRSLSNAQSRCHVQSRR